MIRSIVAIDSARGFATDGGIPWQGKLPGDGAYYIDHVAHTSVIMGRKTYDDMARQPVSDNTNYVVTSQTGDLAPGFIKLDQPAFMALLERGTDEDIWIIGGQGVYEAALPYCQELYITQLAGDFGCTRIFPAFTNDFELASESEPQTEYDISYRFQVWRRMSP